MGKVYRGKRLFVVPLALSMNQNPCSSAFTILHSSPYAEYVTQITSPVIFQVPAASGLPVIWILAFPSVVRTSVNACPPEVTLWCERPMN